MKYYIIHSAIGLNYSQAMKDVSTFIVQPEVWPVNTAGDKGDDIFSGSQRPDGLTFPEDYPVTLHRVPKVCWPNGTNVTL